MLDAREETKKTMAIINENPTSAAVYKTPPPKGYGKIKRNII